MSDDWPPLAPLSPSDLLAKRGTPVVDAMRYWLTGDVSVPANWQRRRRAWSAKPRCRPASAPRG